MAIWTLPVGAADAGTGSTVTAKSPLAAPGAAAATAECPAARGATGAGFRVADPFEPPPIGSGARTLTQVVAPAGKRAWRVAGEAFGTTATTLTAAVRCGAVGSVRSFSQTTALDPGIAKRLEARCPPTRTLLAGGFRVKPAFHFTPLPTGGALIVPLESRRVGRNWRVTAANVALGNSVQGKLTAYALCAAGSDKPRTVRKASAIDYLKRAAAVARCPRGSHAVAGGFKASPVFDDSTKAKYMLPLFDLSAPQGSRAWAVAASWSAPFTGNVTSGRIASYAYCLDN